MAYEFRIRLSTSLGGRSGSSQTNISGEGLAAKEVSIAAAKVGQLTTRTDANTGTLTMTTGHGITTGARIDIYWTGGSQRAVTVGTVSVNSVPFDLGVGDDLPSNLTAITACVAQEEELLVTGDDVTAIEFYADTRATIVLAESDDSEVTATIDGLGLDAERSQLWHAGLNPTSPVAGADVAKAFFSNGDSTAAATVRVQCVYN